jgi:hypothetical protein
VLQGSLDFLPVVVAGGRAGAKPSKRARDVSSGGRAAEGNDSGNLRKGPKRKKLSDEAFHRYFFPHETRQFNDSDVHYKYHAILTNQVPNKVLLDAVRYLLQLHILAFQIDKLPHCLCVYALSAVCLEREINSVQGCCYTCMTQL